MAPLYSKRAAKYLDALDAFSQQRIRSGIARIPEGDIKPLRGSPGSYRLRIGDWRILFSYQGKETVLIEDIGPRGQIYKGA